MLAAPSFGFTDKLKEQFTDLLNKLKDIGMGALATAAQQALDAGKESLSQLLEQLQSVNPLGKRFLPEADKVAEIYQKIKDAIETNTEKAKELYGQAVDKLKDLVNQAGNLDVAGGLQSLKDKLAAIKDKIDGVVAGHKRATRAITFQMTHDIAKAFPMYRRDVGQKITDFFKPHLDKIQEVLGNTGDAIKDHSTNLWETIKGHAGALGDKLQGHLDQLKEHGNTLVGHGTDAVNALKESVTDILNQTFQNMVGTIKDSIDTGSCNDEVFRRVERVQHCGTKDPYRENSQPSSISHENFRSRYSSS